LGDARDFTGLRKSLIGSWKNVGYAVKGEELPLRLRRLSLATPDIDCASKGAPSMGVQCIQIKEPVPAQFSELGSLDSWRLMARRTAYDALLQKLQPSDAFTTRFSLSEVWETDPMSFAKQLVIVCELHYEVLNRKEE
jgi:hypothetical protein